jgi:hypothetical protein
MKSKETGTLAREPSQDVGTVARENYLNGYGVPRAYCMRLMILEF